MLPVHRARDQELDGDMEIARKDKDRTRPFNRVRALEVRARDLGKAEAVEGAGMARALAPRDEETDGSIDKIFF